MKKLCIYVFASVLLPGSVIARTGSLLAPATFPKTYTDLSFTERIENERIGYEPYAGLSAYHQMHLESQEDAAAAAIEFALRASGINDDYFMTPAEEQIAEQQAITQYIPPAQLIAPTTPGEYGYCSKIHPGLTGQKIPFGMPVNPDDLNGKTLSPKAQKLATRNNMRMYCDGYACRPKPDNQSDRPHKGIDLGCNGDFYQMPIYATADGIVQVVLAEGNNPSAGNFIRIDHGAGWKTQYMHLDQMFVTPGQQVSAGCIIGLMGHTGGNADYAHLGIAKDMTHLHYGILYSGSKTQVTAPNGKTVPIKRGNTCKNGKNFGTNIDPQPLIYYQ